MRNTVSDFFSLFGLPVSFQVDILSLEGRYIELQRQYHPDRWIGKPEKEKLAAVQTSMQLNAGYETLKDPLKRAEYLLALQGIVVNADKATVKPGMDILEESMEAREALGELQDKQALNAFTETIQQQRIACITALEQWFSTENYAKAAQETIRLKYLDTLQQEVKRKAMLVK